MRQLSAQDTKSISYLNNTNIPKWNLNMTSNLKTPTTYNDTICKENNQFNSKPTVKGPK